MASSCESRRTAACDGWLFKFIPIFILVPAKEAGRFPHELPALGSLPFLLFTTGHFNQLPFRFRLVLFPLQVVQILGPLFYTVAIDNYVFNGPVIFRIRRLSLVLILSFPQDLKLLLMWPSFRRRDAIRRRWRRQVCAGSDVG